MNSWKVILASLMIFGTGVVIGGVVANRHPLFHHRHDMATPPEVREHRDVPPPPLVTRLGKQLVQQLDDKLQLTPEQKEKIQKIVADGQDRNHAIWTNVSPQFRSVIQDVHQQIREQLTPEQREQFEEMLKRPPRKSGSTNAPAVKPPAPDAVTNSPAASIRKDCA